MTISRRTLLAATGAMATAAAAPASATARRDGTLTLLDPALAAADLAAARAVAGIERRTIEADLVWQWRLLTQPVLLVNHADDDCAFTQPRSAGRFKALLTRAAKADIVVLRGGPDGSGEQCEAQGHHGFWGQDEEVVTTVTNWLKGLR